MAEHREDHHDRRSPGRPDHRHRLPPQLLLFIGVLGLGIIAALDQVGIATTVTTPVLIPVLAFVGGDPGWHRA